VNQKADFFYKTNRFESIRITNRIGSIRIANWNALEDNAIGCVCPSVCFHFILRNNWSYVWLWFCCMCMGQDNSSWGLKVKVIGQGQKPIQKCACHTSIYCGVLWVLIDCRSRRFPLWRHQLRASAVKRWEWHGRGHRRRASVVGLTSILNWGQFLTLLGMLVGLQKRTAFPPLSFYAYAYKLPFKCNVTFQNDQFYHDATRRH